MAEIPVHKKSSLAWLWWLLALIALALLLWWLFADNDDDVATPVVTDNTAPLVVDNTMGMDNTMGVNNAMVATNGMGTTDTVATAGTGTITDYNQLAAANLDTMVGRKVAFQNVPVESVTDDMGFWIGDSKANRTYVAFHEYPSPNNPNMEGNVDVNNPSRVMIEGEVVRNTGKPAPGIKVTLPKVSSYIRASKVAVVNNR